MSEAPAIDLLFHSMVTQGASDLHLCVVAADQVVPAVPDAIAAVGGAVREGRPVTFVSGPSATADIELNRVQGVHGPRTLDVFVLEG